MNIYRNDGTILTEREVVEMGLGLEALPFIKNKNNIKKKNANLKQYHEDMLVIFYFSVKIVYSLINNFLSITVFL
jgi:hypothetical protein